MKRQIGADAAGTSLMNTFTIEINSRLYSEGLLQEMLHCQQRRKSLVDRQCHPNMLLKIKYVLIFLEHFL